MNNIYDVLEVCLQELENGADVEVVLARYPDLAAELRPILRVSVMARGMATPAPSTEAFRRGRAKVLQHAAQIRETKVASRSRRMTPTFQRFAIALTLAAIFLTSGTGLVSASSSALPGENLYPVKLTWENVRIFLTFNEEYRETLEHEFENERLHEVIELLVEGRNETIQFSGIYNEVNGITYVSGIHVVILDTSILPLTPLVDGAAVVVTGHTNAEGFVDVESIELLPGGSVVPTGEPVEAEESYKNNGAGSKNENESKNGNVNDRNDAIGDNSGKGGGDDNSSDGGYDNANDNENNNDDNDASADENNNNDDGNGNNSGSGGGGDDNSGSGGGGDDSGDDGGDDSDSGGGGDDGD